MASFSSGSKILTLRSSDGQTLDVEESIASHSFLLKRLIKQSDSNVLPKLEVKGSVLRKIIEYITDHFDVDNPKKLKNKGKIVVPEQLDLEGYLLRYMMDYINYYLERLGEKGKSIVVNDEEKIEGYDTAFLGLNSTELFDLLVAADYLGVGRLYDNILDMVVGMIKRKSPDELREILNMVNDFPDDYYHRLLCD